MDQAHRLSGHEQDQQQGGGQHCNCRSGQERSMRLAYGQHDAKDDSGQAQKCADGDQSLRPAPVYCDTVERLPAIIGVHDCGSSHKAGNRARAPGLETDSHKISTVRTMSAA
jgi:hypothetical protein